MERLFDGIPVESLSIPQLEAEYEFMFNQPVTVYMLGQTGRGREDMERAIENGTPVEEISFPKDPEAFW